MSDKANKAFKATFILDTRGYEQPVETLPERIKEILGAIGATEVGVSSLGRADFTRVTEKQHTGDHYFEATVRATGDTHNALQTHTRLNKLIKRFIICAA